MVAQRNDTSPSERGDVHHRSGFEAFGVGQRVAQDEAAFRIGVQDFDGLARHAGDHIARFYCRATGHVLASRDDADQVNF